MLTKSQGSDCTIHRVLTFDSLLHVFKVLPFVERVKCERVCKKWSEASVYTNSFSQTSLCFVSQRKLHANGLLQNFCLDTLHHLRPEDCIFAPEPTICPIIDVVRRCPNLRSLHIRCFSKSSLCFGDIEELGELCPKLEHVSFVDDLNPGLLIYSHAIKLVKSCRSLKHLQLRFPIGSSFGFILENLIITRSLNLSKENLDTLVVNVPLNAENCTLLAVNCPLRKLIVHGTTIPCASLSALLAPGSLVAKNLRALTLILEDDEQVDIISQRLLNLNSLHCIVGCDLLGKIGSLSNLTNLRSLFLSVWSKKSADGGLKDILKGCRRLRSLTVSAEVSDASLRTLSRYCPDIERLEITVKSKSSSLTDSSVRDSFINLTRLKHLALHHTDITDDGLKVLLKSAHELSYLRITSAQNLTTLSVGQLVAFSNRRKEDTINAVLPKSLGTKSLANFCSYKSFPRNLFLSFI